MVVSMGVCVRARALFFALNVIVSSIKMALNKVREKKVFIRRTKRNEKIHSTLHGHPISFDVHGFNKVHNEFIITPQNMPLSTDFCFCFWFFVAAGTGSEWKTRQTHLKGHQLKFIARMRAHKIYISYQCIIVNDEIHFKKHQQCMNA